MTLPVAYPGTSGPIAFSSVTVTGSSAPTNGLYLPAANTVGIATNGVLRVSVSTTLVSSTLPITVTSAASVQTVSSVQGLRLNSSSAVTGEGCGISLSNSSGSIESFGIIGLVNGGGGNFDGRMVFHTYSGGATIDKRMELSSSALTLSTGVALVLPTTTPASAAAAGVAGTVTWDAGFFYVCTATNTWERVAIATW